MNSYRSAVSMAHSSIDGVVVGKHPLVVRLMRGVYNAQPLQPRYSTTWGLGQVLHHISSLRRNRDLSLKQVSHNLVVLLALANASCKTMVVLARQEPLESVLILSPS